MNSGAVLALHPLDNVFRTRDPPDFEDFVEKDPTGRYLRDSGELVLVELEG
ncbi:putative serine/threonine-protein kinase [Sesbania bispinosa]|nr:putative serine/threonine-protein kinase [Sesbania bispinosa]